MKKVEIDVSNLSKKEMEELAKEGRRIYAKEYRKRKKESLKRNSDVHFARKALSKKEEIN